MRCFELLRSIFVDVVVPDELGLVPLARVEVREDLIVDTQLELLSLLNNIELAALQIEGVLERGHQLASKE